MLSFLTVKHRQPSENGLTWLHSGIHLAFVTVVVNSLKISRSAFTGNVHVQVFVT